MKLYRKKDGGYALRDTQPVDHWDRPVWTEVTLGYSQNEINNVQVYPLDKPEDAVTLTKAESLIFYLAKAYTSIDLLQRFFLLRRPDRILDLWKPSIVEFTGNKLSYLEWEGNHGWFDFTKPGANEDEGAEDSAAYAAEAVIRGVHRALGDLP